MMRRQTPFFSAGIAFRRCAALLLAVSVAAALQAQTTTFLGEVAPLPNSVAEITSPATGVMISARERPFTVGDRVKKGEALLVISNRYNLHDASHLSNGLWDFERQMIEARYAALEAKVAREKAERLKGLGSVSGRQLAELRAAEQVAQAEYQRQLGLYEQQQEQYRGDTLERRGLVSPIDGQITAATFTQGQMVYEGLLLYRIVNLQEVAVSARVPEAAFRPWPLGTTAKIQFDDIPGKEFAGKLEIIAPTVDPLSRTRNVVFRVENPGERLRFGMIGHVEIRMP